MAGVELREATHKRKEKAARYLLPVAEFISNVTNACVAHKGGLSNTPTFNSQSFPNAEYRSAQEGKKFERANCYSPAQVVVVELKCAREKTIGHKIE